MNDARDLYDVINLYRNDQLPAPAIISDVLAQKCAYKEIEKPKLANMDNYREALIQNWEPMLAHQLPALAYDYRLPCQVLPLGRCSM